MILACFMGLEMGVAGGLYVVNGFCCGACGAARRCDRSLRSLRSLREARGEGGYLMKKLQRWVVMGGLLGEWARAGGPPQGGSSLKAAGRAVVGEY
jgi:hypothetical protein